MATSARRTARTSTASTAPAPRSSGYRGAEGLRKMEEEEAKAQARREASAMSMNMPFRYFRPPNSEPGEYIIVDDAPDFFRSEHNLKDKRTGRYSIFCACIDEFATCPVCKVAERPAYFAMYLTIIDLTPYTDKNGNEVEWSKKLLVVKPAQQKKFTRLLERHKSLRGMLMEAVRDGEKDSAIGNEQEFIEMVPEEELLIYETEYTDKKDKVHVIIGHEPFDYDELFPMPTEQQLRALVGGAAEPGSRDDDDRTLGRSRSSRPARSAPKDGWDDDAPPRRARASREEAEEEPAAAPATRRGRAAVAEDPPWDDEDGDAEDADTPVRRTRAATTSRAVDTRDAPQRPTRRAAPARDEEEEPPARPTPQSLAERRRALRR